jgi:hypothetical protein
VSPEVALVISKYPYVSQDVALKAGQAIAKYKYADPEIALAIDKYPDVSLEVAWVLSKYPDQPQEVAREAA